MTRKKLFCGIIGSGFSASFHVDSVRRVFGVDVEIAGVYSPNKEHRTQFGKIKNVTVVDSLDELIENADVLHICAPPYAHEPLAIQVLSYNKSVIVEKPFTGYFGDGSESFDGKTFPREIGLERAMESVKKMIDAERKSKGRIFYSENWVYAPAIQKEKEIIEKTDAQIIWIHGEESHSGSHSRYYGIWSYSGGGSMIGKGVHPLTAALYLKKVEGRVLVCIRLQGLKNLSTGNTFELNIRIPRILLFSMLYSKTIFLQIFSLQSLFLEAYITGLR